MKADGKHDSIEELVKPAIVRQESTFSNKSWCMDDDLIEDSSNQEWDMT